MLAESQKSSTMKIDEPKTPFIHTLPSDSSEEDSTGGEKYNFVEMPFIELEGGDLTEEEEEEEEVVSEYEAEEQREANRIAKEEEDFEKHRSAHYNMKEALSRGKQLLSSEEEEEED